MLLNATVSLSQLHERKMMAHISRLCPLRMGRGKKLHKQTVYWCTLGNKESVTTRLPSYLFWLKGRRQASPGENPTCIFLSHSTECSWRETNVTWPCIKWDGEQTGRMRTTRNGVKLAWYEGRKNRHVLCNANTRQVMQTRRQLKHPFS